MRPPELDDLAAAPLLAALALLDLALVVVARAVHAAHPEVDRAAPDDTPLTAAAHDLIEACDFALAALDAFREHLASGLRAPDREREWPF
jgi:hypothetical protein